MVNPSYFGKISVNIAVGLVITASYLVLLAHTIQGNYSRWLIANEVLICLSGITLIVYGYGYWRWYIMDPPSQTTTTIWLIGVGSGMGEGFQAIAHFFLAMKYRDISKNVPKIIEGKKIEPKSTAE